MKKILFVLSLIALPVIAFAQNDLDPVAVASPIVQGFDLKVFIQQILTNGGLVLLGFLFSKIPVIGPYLGKIIDVLAANPAHKEAPKP
jgi:hypothetical protein